MPSISAKITSNILEMFNFKSIVDKALQNPSRRSKPFNLLAFEKTFLVTEFRIMGKSVVTLQPKSSISDKHVIFLHGGAYVLEGSAMHWKLLKDIATNASCKASYFDYPLAPECIYLDTFAMLQQAYNKLVTDYPNDKFIFVGDSAGGGLALAFAQKLLVENFKIQPIKCILFSPWVDISMTNPDILLHEKKDKILSLTSLKKAAQKYAGVNADLNHYLLSPINGIFEGLNTTMFFYGTDELLCADMLKLEAKTHNTDNFIFHAFEDMQHDWVLFPIPEAKIALKMAVDFIKL